MIRAFTQKAGGFGVLQIYAGRCSWTARCGGEAVARTMVIMWTSGECAGCDFSPKIIRNLTSSAKMGCRVQRPRWQGKALGGPKKEGLK